MISPKIYNQIETNIDTIVKKDSALGIELWNELLKIHPADLATFFTNIDKEDFKALFIELPEKNKASVFDYLSDSMKAFSLSFVKEEEKPILLESISIEELTDLFDYLSDEEIKDYFELLHKKDREKVLSLMKFSPESAGGIMDPYVVTFREYFTIEQSINILQRVRPSKDLHQQIYVTDKDNRLVGHILLEDLLLKSPKTKLSNILRTNELVVPVDEDQEEIAKKMMHYSLMTVPVVSENEIFLGVIPSTTLVDIIEQEATEDIYKISGMAPIKKSYFEIPFFKHFFDRGYILAILLMIESFSSTILKAYEHSIVDFSFLGLFIPMLVSTGGNTSSQTSALAIQGLALGEINYSNIRRFFKREFFMAFCLAIMLGIIAFARVYFTYGRFLASIVVSMSLSLIVMLSVVLGSCIPLLLKKINIDPAFAAGPFLATIVDILGILIYCYISKLILS